MKLALFLWIISIYGIVFRSNNFILMLICLELMLLAISFLIIYNSIILDDITGQIIALHTVGLAGAESAIGLSILMSYFRLRGSVSLISNQSNN